ncbi:MAG: prepilin-type N-terminal cleavage/methylation domain-containing protein [Phycisphaerales bacterium]|nr:prepilin-type N-terminal cleavage/methylation domain-containing protein [Phycisphaerales bacterium]
MVGFAPIDARRTTRPRRPGRRSRGFTLLETLLALTIISVGVLAVMGAQRQFTYQNLWSTHASTAAYLANEVREFTRALPRIDTSRTGLYLSSPNDPNSLVGWGPDASVQSLADVRSIVQLDGVVLGSATVLPDGFPMARRFRGPVNASGEVINEVDWDGNVRTVAVPGGDAAAVPMEGWTQIIRVQKVDPADLTRVVPNGESVPGVRAVDQYPFRVTVTILYQGVWEQQAPAVTTVSWVVPP